VDIVNLTEKGSRIGDYWHPRIAGELDDSYVKLVKLKGEFLWQRLQVDRRERALTWDGAAAAHGCGRAAVGGRPSTQGLRAA
jgi:hypothetical protein